MLFFRRFLVKSLLFRLFPLLSCMLQAIGFFACDQLTKSWALSHLNLHQASAFWPGVLQLRLTMNTGIAFSFFQQAPDALRLFTVILLVIFVLICLQKKTWTLREPLAYALILGGAAGNIRDRFVLGAVVDFIEWLPFRFPIFNFADAFITCGAALLLLHFMETSRKRPQWSG